MNITQRIVACAVLAVLAGCLSGCAGVARSVPMSDFFGQKPKVQIAWPNMVLAVPTNYPSSAAKVISARVFWVNPDGSRKELEVAPDNADKK